MEEFSICSDLVYTNRRAGVNSCFSSFDVLICDHLALEHLAYQCVTKVDQLSKAQPF